MNRKKVFIYLDIANQNQLITIFNGTGKPLEFIKKNITYMMDKDLNALIIIDKPKKDLHILPIRYIRQISLESIKFNPISWCDCRKIDEENKIKV